ncbi:CsxC family protein [Neobacillus sp. D3-1R]|uniref:CsxC family protein n=1 Tax=Neobacillus sp. D3-1R TaxID=3445778 RepID=UPI003FA18F8C
MSNNCQDNNCVDFGQSAGVDACCSSQVNPVTQPGNPVTGQAVLRVPVTLAERRVSTVLSTHINFPDSVLEIKDIKKRVKIVQCSLMLQPVTCPEDAYNLADATLVIKGFVRKNIQYATPTSDISADCVSSTLRSLTTDVPFECMTIIPASAFLSRPQRPVLNARAEFDFFRSQSLGVGFPEKDQLLSSDLSQFHQTSTAYYNQLPFCEILSHNILEWDESVDRSGLGVNAPFEEGVFTRISEKMVLNFDIKVLQNQQVVVNPLTFIPPTNNGR